VAEFGGSGVTAATLCGTANPRRLFVDPGTTEPTLGQTGTERCAFATAQQAVNAAAQEATIYIRYAEDDDGDPLSGGNVNCGTKELHFIGEGSSVDGQLARLGNVQGEGAAFVSLENLRAENISDDWVCTLNGCLIQGGSVAVHTLTAIETTFIFGDGDVITTSTGDATFRHCDFDVSEEATPEIIPTAGVFFDRVSAQNFQAGGGWKITIATTAQLPQDLEPNLDYGDGSDGSLSSGFGTVTLTRDTYYQNLEFGPTDTIRTNGWRIFIAGLLDLRSAPAKAIDISTSGSNVGVDASGQTAGTVSVTLREGTLPIGTPGVGQGGKGGAAGAAGAGAGNGGAAASLGLGIIGGFGGAGGKGGSVGGAGAGGGPGAFSSSMDAKLPRNSDAQLAPAFAFTFRSSEAGAGGGGGGGGPTDVGGGGGCPARGPSCGQVFARCIIRDSTTNAGAIDGGCVRSGNGGNGTTDGAGGAGAGGCGGAGVGIYCDWLLGEPVACVNLNGGAGGTGGNGAGTAPGGEGGTGGSSGTLLVGERIKNQFSFTPRVAGSAPGAVVGTTGGPGGAGGVLTGTL
jgi:hypothetical protein